MERQRITKPLSLQMRERVNTKTKKEELDGNFKTIISTGSTLLDLSLSGGRVRGGGLPGGILVEIFGPSGSGKTVLLSEIAGAVQRLGGDAIFYDPEARLDKTFAKLFGLQINEENYKRPNKVTEVFQAVRNWEPKDPNIINGVFADSLTALSTTMEMDNVEGDRMGGRRAKEFSEELRRTCRIIADKNYLMVCSNQTRQKMDAGPYEQKWTVPGGEAMTFYPSIRLKFNKPNKIWQKEKVAGKEVKRVIGVEVDIEVFKSSIWKPFHIAPVTILFDYGIDDIRQNLQFMKDHTGAKVYIFENTPLSNSMEESIHLIEQDKLEQRLRNEVIELWEDIESKFKQERKPKR